MRRVVAAAVGAAVAGLWLLAFNAPAEGATGYAGVMTTGGLGFKFAKGVCGNASGDGNFSIEVGDSITWTNCSNTGHTVTGDGFGSSDVIAPGSSTPAYQFDVAGTFAYHCEIHPSMTGVVTVTGPPPTVPPTTPTTGATTSTTAKPTTTTSTTVAPTTTTDEFDGVTSSTTPTSIDPTVTTRALGEGGDSGTSAGVVGLLIVGLGAVGTAGALIIRRLRAS